MSSYPFSDGPLLQGVYSLSFWLKVNELPSTGEKTVMMFGGNAMRMVLTPPGLVFEAEDASNENTYHSLSPVTITPDSWMHIIAIKDGDTLTLYVNNLAALVSNSFSNLKTSATSQTSLLMGYSDSADALVDDIIVFSKALSSDEVNSLYSPYGSVTEGPASGIGTVLAGEGCVPDSTNSLEMCIRRHECLESTPGSGYTCVPLTSGESLRPLPEYLDSDGDGLVNYYDADDTNAEVLFEYQLSDGSIDPDYEFDADGNGQVEFSDLVALVVPDFNGDGEVNVNDLIFLFERYIPADFDVSPYVTVTASDEVSLVIGTNSVPTILQLDTDSDRVPDILDSFPEDASAISDTDRDGKPDVLVSSDNLADGFVFVSEEPYTASVSTDGSVIRGYGFTNADGTNVMIIDEDGDGVPSIYDVNDNHAGNTFMLNLDGVTVSDFLIEINRAGFIEDLNSDGNIDDTDVIISGLIADGDGDNYLSTDELVASGDFEYGSSGLVIPVDSDGDGVPNIFDDFPDDPAYSYDADEDGSPDVFASASVGWTILEEDLDDDGDGVDDLTDDFPYDAAASVDSDRDGSPDSLVAGITTTLVEDPDDDGDGVGDIAEESGCSLSSDCDSDGTPDATDTADTDPAVPGSTTSTSCTSTADCEDGFSCRIAVSSNTGTCTINGLPPQPAGPSSFSSYFLSDDVQQVMTATEASLVLDNQASWGYELDSAAIRTTPSTGITYFNFNGKTYVVDILEYSPEDGEAKLGIREIGKEDYLRAKKVGGSGTSDKVTLKIDEDALIAMLPMVPIEKPLMPQTVSLDLAGSNEPEFYVHFAGKLGSLDVLVTMSPLVDLSLYPSGSMIMHSETPLQFRYTDGTYHTITYIYTGSDYVIAVDGVSHIGDSTTTDILDHLGSPDEEVGVKIRVVSARGDYAVVTLEPITTDLSASYMGVFDKLTRTLTLSTATYKICNDDPLDLEFVRVCNIDNVFQFGLTVNTPYEDPAQLGILFYYTYPESRKPKEVKAYRLLDLSDPDTEVLEPGFTFSSNLVMDNGLAFKVQDILYDVETYDYYLLTLPEDAETMNFEELIVTPLSDLNLQPPLPQSDKQRAIFNLPVERRTEEEANRVRQFNVLRVIDGTNVNYALSAVTLNKVVNLKRALQTSVDTFGGADVWLEGEQVGLVGVASTAQDTSPEFAELYIEDPDERTLVYENKPTVFESYPDLLFIYSEHRANRDNYHSKKVDVHLLYPLGDEVETATAVNPHKYTDEDFNLPMMKGYKMALEVAGNYYLLGYNPSKPWTGTEFFDAKELRLTRVGATETITKEYMAATNTMKFTLGNNYVVNVHFNLENLEEKVIEFDYDAPQGTFLAFTPELEFEAELPDRSSTELYDWLRIAGRDIYRNCDTPDYLSFTTKMLLCDDHDDSAGNDGEIVKIMEPFIRPYATGENVLVTFREAYAGRKVVTFQYIWEELNQPGGRNSEELRWSAFNTLLSEDKNPVVVVDGDYFEIIGGQIFADLGLRNLTSAVDYPVTHYLQNEGEDQGMVLVGETVFTFEQNDNLGNVEIKVGRADYLYVDAEGFDIGEETTQGFITKIDEKVKENIYTLILTPITRGSVIVGEQVQVQQASENPTRPVGSLLFSGNVPLMVTKEILLPNGDKIKVKPYTQIVDGVPQVRVRVSR